MSKFRSVMLASIALTVFSVLGRCQATVNENLETALIYVDAINGSDSSPGTASQPLQTISAAAILAETNNQNGVGSEVIINPGDYREAVTLNWTPNTSALPITFQAAIPGTAIVSGADVWTGWTPYSGNSSIYTNPWPYAWGLCTPAGAGPAQADIVLRREMVFVNGTMLTEVLSLNEVTVGTFFVDETGGTIYAWPPTGTNMGSATVEVSTRPQVWTIQGQSNVVTRGLTFEYANPCWSDGAVQVLGSPSNILFDTDNFNWNSAEGLQIWNSATNYTVQNSTATHNGESGFAAYQVLNSLYQADVAAFNNWRGAQGAYYGWNSAAFHFTGTHTNTANNLQSYYNEAQGLHYDTDNQNITINSLSSYQDLGIGLFFEVTQGPVAVTNSAVCSGNPPPSSLSASLSLRDSEFISVTGSNFVNAPSSLAIDETAGGSWVTNWETNQQSLLFTQNLALTNNVFQTGSGQQVFSGGGLVTSEWAGFQSTLTSNDNTWWNASNSIPFSVPVPNSGSLDTFSQWQAATGQDQQSVFQAPPANPAVACVGSPDMTDYWFLIPNSQATIFASPDLPAVWNASIFPLDFTGTVTLSYDGIQNIPGASANWSATSVGPNGTSNFTVNLSPTTPAGIYPVTLIATSGNLTHTITVFLSSDPTVQFSPTSLNFGNQLQGTGSTPQQVTLTNASSTPLTITSVAVGGMNIFDFTESNNCGSSLASNSTCTITVTFTPQTTGSRAATLIITDPDPTSPQQIPLSGTGTAPAASLSPGSLTFASQSVGTTSPAQPVTLTNTGTSALNITSISITGNGSANFAETNNCGTSLAASASCTVNLTFTPSSNGTHAANLTVADSAGGGTQIVSASGTGVQAAVTLSNYVLAFGTQVWGVTAPAQTVTVTNGGTATLNITSIAITGSNAGDFAQTNNCGTSLGVGLVCTINVTFTPTNTGSRSASVSLSDNAPTSPQTVNLNGSGLTSVSFSPKSLTFASRLEGTTSPPQEVTVTNSGNTLAIQSISISGANAGDFAATNNCGSSLATGASCSVSLTFTPSTGSSESASLSVYDADPTSPQVVTLSGTGTTAPAVTLSASSLTFANQVVGTLSPQQAVTLTNTGSASLSISSIAVTGGNTGDFSETNNCGLTVAAGASCAINLTFDPVGPGTQSAKVSITDNATPATQTVSLSGTGTQSEVSRSKYVLAFGSRVWNTTGSAEAVTVTNSGTAALNISSISISGSNPEDFVQTNNCGTSLAAGATCSVNAGFTPTALGLRSASITLIDNAPTSPQTVNLNGTGKTSLSFSPKSIIFTTRKVGTSSGAWAISVTNLGNSLTLSGITLSGANAGDFAETNTCGTGLASGASCTINVTFTPGAVGSRTAGLNINDNDPSSPQQVSLSGTGD